MMTLLQETTEQHIYNTTKDQHKAFIMFQHNETLNPHYITNRKNSAHLRVWMEHVYMNDKFPCVCFHWKHIKQLSSAQDT